ncbi:sodium:proton antiporter [Candidatus Bipolaricaulota bacterium]|nr:sodium:proton antiporter [Candidatus Bipolaricaulota bacterium]
MNNTGMSVIVRTVTRFMYGLIILFGFYVIMHGHLTPGGGFQGGAVVASAFALLLVAFGSAGLKGRLNLHWLQTIEEFGVLSFLALAFLGIGTAFFYNLFANSGGFLFGASVPTGSNAGVLTAGGLVPLMNWAVGLKVMTGIAAIVIIMLIGSRKEETE